MEEPKFKIGIWLSAAISIEGILVGVAFQFSWSLAWTLVSLLLTLVALLVGFFIDSYLQFRKFYIAIKDIQTRHLALSQQFDQKNKILDEYESAFTYFGYSITTSVTLLKEKERSQLDNLHTIFLSIQKSIRREKL